VVVQLLTVSLSYPLSVSNELNVRVIAAEDDIIADKVSELP
jgi:hypothetical protein